MLISVRCQPEYFDSYKNSFQLFKIQKPSKSPILSLATLELGNFIVSQEISSENTV